MDKGEAINKVAEYKRILNNYIQFESVYLFGSYAKGTNRNDSDIDVAIVVNRADGDFFSVRPTLWKLRRLVDDRIEPVLIERDFDDADFLGEIQKYGIEIV
jgi:uncharacterized protein